MEREQFSFSQFSYFKKDEKTKNIEELEEYLKRIDKINITYREKLKVGDEVKLKGVDYSVIVKYIDYEITGIGKVDYAGKRTDEEDDLLTLFNQKDIEAIVSKENNMPDGDKEER